MTSRKRSLLEELELALCGRPTFDVAATVAERKAGHARHQKLTPPSVIVGRYDANAPLPHPINPDTKVLHGVGVSPGVVTGLARVILQADANAHVLPGEILVAPYTDPGWTPYFLPAAGIVVDIGGLLSHGSVVAREYGLPAVVNVGPATRLIRTGDVKNLFDARVRAQMPANQRFEYWKPGPSIAGLVNDDFVSRQKDLAIEKHLLLKELLGTDASAEPDLTPGLHVFDMVLDFTTPEKRSQVLEVELLNLGRMVAASDQNSIAKAQAEKEQFLNTILTSEEKFEYDVRLSLTALSQQGRLGGFAPTEQEFREMVRLQKQFDDAHGWTSQAASGSDAAERRATAQKELESQTRNLLGDERYREYVNEQNWSGSSLRKVAQDYNIPKETAFKVFDLTDAAKEAAERVRADALRSDAQKQAALDAIRAETENAVGAVIGPDAMQAYVKGGSAIKNLNRLR